MDKAVSDAKAAGIIGGGSGSAGSAASESDITMQACVEDKWPQATQECLIKAADVAPWRDCIAALPADIHKRWTERTAVVKP